MNLFNQRKPKRFSYTPREVKDKDKTYAFESRWQPKTLRKKKSPALGILMVVLGMVIVIWYVLSNYEI